MKCTIVVAMGQHREIGKANDLPWHLPRDMQFFKETTSGHTVVMGRKNWESIPEKFRPLPHRTNVVLSRDTSYRADGATVVHSWEALEDTVDSNQKCFIIGGAEIFRQALERNIIHEMFVTQIEATFEADVYFPFVDWEKWEEEDVLNYQKDTKNAYNFTIKHYFLNEN